jgi:16S rRNA (cytosine967-C5)-methyltransferase
VNKVSESRSVSPARAAAFDILVRVERESSYASELLHSGTHATLSALDHSLATELVMGVLRWRSLLDTEISQYSSKPLGKLDIEILIALRLAAYQLLWLSHIPHHAAINESVELVKRARKRSAASFVNAVLRKLSARGSRPPLFDNTSAESLAASSAHPLWIVERWSKAYGAAAARQICEYDQSPPMAAIRLRHPEVENQFRTEGIELVPGFMLASTRRVRSGNIAKSLAFKEGRCVIQDEASQLVALLVGHGTTILDCCAAPGGKTLVIADRNSQAQLTAVELHPHRARLLQKLLRKNCQSGSNRTGIIDVIAADARDLPFAAKFGRILADVPCSGTGTLSRNPEIKWRLTYQDILDLQARQFAILRSAMERVAPGGRIVYSTCSLEHEENEEIVERALAENSSFKAVECGSELAYLRELGELTIKDVSSLISDPYLRTLPGVHPCDGFFAAILEKNR